MKPANQWLKEAFPNKEERKVITRISCVRSSLVGPLDLREFPSLEWLDITDNQITNLDLTNNPSLRFINCSSNPIKALDLSLNPNLEEIHASFCQFTKLDLSQSLNLTDVCVNNNLLERLDTSKNAKLQALHVYKNKLKGLDLKNNKELSTLSIHTNAALGGDLDLTHLPKLSNLICFNTKLTSLKLNNPCLHFLDCEGTPLQELDLSKTAIRESDYGTTLRTSLEKEKIIFSQLAKPTIVDSSSLPQDGSPIDAQLYLDRVYPKESRSQVTEMNISRKNLKGRLDLRDFTNLQKLNASHNDITSVDLSCCPKLYDCVLSGNSYLAEVDTSQNPNLKNLVLQYTDVKQLDLSKNQELDILSVAFSPIERIDVSQNPKIRTVRCLSCHYLKEVIGIAGKENFQNFISSLSSLEEIDLSNCPKLFMSTFLGTKKLKKIDLNNCFNLSSIISPSCPQLTNLDLSTNTNLEVISIEDTPLKELDLSKTKVKERYLKRIGKEVKVIPPTYSTSPNPELIEAQEYLDNVYPKEQRYHVKEMDLVQRNLKGHLDLRTFTNLEKINVRDNDISSVDLSDCARLEDVVLSRNTALKEVDLSKNLRLKKLLATHCEIKSLDFSKCPKLEVTDLSSTPLQKLDFTHNPDLKSVIVSFCHELKEITGVKNKERLVEVGGFQETFLTELDFSGCPKLYHFYLPNQRNLTKLNISGCKNLGMMILEGCTQLTDLDLSEQTNLRILDIGSTNIKKLDYSKTKLKPQYQQLVERQLKENRTGLQFETVNHKEARQTSNKPSLWQQPSTYLLLVGGIGIASLGFFFYLRRKKPVI